MMIDMWRCAMLFGLQMSLGVTLGCEAVVEIEPGKGGGPVGGAPDPTGGSSGVLAGGFGADGGAPAAIDCQDPEPILTWQGSDTGYVLCADGAVDRVAVVECEQPYPFQPECDGSEDETFCDSDSDCTEGPHGRCVQFEVGLAPSTQCGCAYGCATDADCSEFPGTACICAGITDELQAYACVPRECSTGADCESGMCGLSSWQGECGFHAQLTCRRPTDTCHSDIDCLELPETQSQCGSHENQFSCQDSTCSPG
jgi:hypothetical protein